MMRARARGVRPCARNLRLRPEILNRTREFPSRDSISGYDEQLTRIINPLLGRYALRAFNVRH